ncbi:sensor histidine kinase [Microlunatus parietis]|uniref:histidine kinase n=1 Tax=Microlunatus parietis TaxID=682979 RepID=A0A7Y9IE42_9ACTN|nr:signal transduction histidine kinase [Microlunatus parietis]
MRRWLERFFSVEGDPRWSPLVIWLAGLGLLALGLGGVWTGTGWPRFDPWWHVVPLTVGCIAIAFSRRHPMIALGVGTVAVLADFTIGGSPGVLLVIFDLLFTAFRIGRPTGRRVIAVSVAVAFVTVLVLIAVLADLRTGIAAALQLTAFLVVPLWWARDLRQKEELARLAAERVELERRRADDLIRVGELDRQRAVQAERASMARDLHDVIASHLSATALQAGAALARPADAGADRKTLESVRESSLAGLAEMRSMIMLLRNETDPDEPVAAPPRLDRISELVKQAEDNGLRIRFAGDAATVPAAVDQTAYRIIAEALVNAAKHAPGSTVELTIDGADPLVVRVENTAGSGAAIHPALSAGHGLAALRDRTAALGGRLSAGPTDHGTWLIEAIIPGGERVRS